MKHIQEHKHKRTLCAFFSPMVCHFSFSQEFIVVVHYEDHNQGRRKISLYLPIVFLFSPFSSFAIFAWFLHCSPNEWERVCVLWVCLHFPSSIHLALNFMAIEKKSAIQKECFFAGIDTHRVWCSIYTISIRVCLNGIAISFLFVQNKWKRFIFNI